MFGSIVFENTISMGWSQALASTLDCRCTDPWETVWVAVPISNHDSIIRGTIDFDMILWMISEVRFTRPLRVLVWIVWAY